MRHGPQLGNSDIRTREMGNATGGRFCLEAGMCKAKKRCSTCGELKGLDQFHDKKACKKDGKYSLCKSCKSKYNKKYQSKNHDAIRKRVRAYEEEHPGAVQRRERAYRATAKGKEVQAAAQARQRKKCPDRIVAGRAVSTAIKSGRLRRGPCEVCGAVENIEAHHDDYSKPLDVRWLCGDHHREVHRQLVDHPLPRKYAEVK